MAKPRKKKQPKGKVKKESIPLTERLFSFGDWKSRSPIILFILGFVGVMVVFYIVYSTGFYLSYIYQPIVKADAWLGSKLLNMLGQGTQVQHVDIVSPAFSISINLGCDGLEAIALYVAAILAYPIKFSFKYKGILLGVVFLFVLNLIRIVTLFLVGKYFPDWFDIMHLEVWQALFLILAVVTWLVWIRWALEKVNKQQTDAKN